ncbi:MAG: bifunctional pyr operon transcriptional regulator/uracil phosphoribosyltransferase PyrR [Desulfovibrio sp.]|nr:bifunctional pyr operon transcriptional regulator/uracil phosphoribosyltransferase PyrR [Desulfovibrio sp.]
MSDCHDLMLARDIGAALERMATEAITRHGSCRDLALIGIQRRGADLAERLKSLLDARLDSPVPLGKLDINLYRDDWTSLDVRPSISHTDIPFDIDGRAIILVDDVLFTGRTVRAGMEAILDFGRPRKIELLALVDRGHRELPIQPDYLGLAVETARSQHVDVLLAERDGEERVCLTGF